jgi:alpha-beta hydrolase superfamily lysophospholipase
VKTFEAEWTDAQGLKFYSKAWEPDRKPRAAVAFLHGLGEHLGRYEHVGAAFAGAGYAMMGFDLRGHGRSGGQRGHTPSAEEYLKDIDLLLQHVRERYGALPLFLYGHSLGAIQALYYTLRRKPDLVGVIASAPALHSELENQPLKVTMARLLGGLASTASIPSGLDVTKLSHDPEIEKVYLSDPLVHHLVSLGFGKTMLDVNRWILQHAAEFPVPLLLSHGAQDAVAFPSSSREVAAAAGDKATLLIWEGMYHETHNEVGKADVLKALIQWMDARLKTR